MRELDVLGSICGAAAAALLAFPASAAWQTNASATAAQSAAIALSEARLRELVGLLSGPTSALRTFSDNAFVADAEGGREERFRRLLSLRDLYSGQVVKVLETDAAKSRAAIRSALTGKLAGLRLDMSKSDPSRIESYSTFGVANLVKPARDFAELETRLDAYARQLADKGYFSGIVAIADGVNPRFMKAYGLADQNFLIPNDPAVKFNMASVNKMFTAVAIAQLVEQGKVGLEDKLSKYLPDFPTKAAADKIRIKHLLSHTAGLADFLDSAAGAAPFALLTVPDVLAVAPRTAPRFEPGTDVAYCNTCMLVLGRVAEIASGEDYYNYVRRHIPERAGMTQTGFFLSTDPGQRIALAYEPSYVAGEVLPSPAGTSRQRGSPAGGGHTTAMDMILFADALRTGKLIRPETVEAFTHPYPGLKSGKIALGFLKNWNAPSGRDVIGHGGNAHGTCNEVGMVRDMDRPYTVVVMANSGKDACGPIVEELYGLLAPPPKE